MNDNKPREMNDNKPQEMNDNKPQGSLKREGVVGSPPTAIGGALRPRTLVPLH
jgi:hypothetical protein